MRGEGGASVLVALTLGSASSRGTGVLQFFW